MASIIAFLFLHNPHRAPPEVTILDHAAQVDFMTLEGIPLSTQHNITLSHDWRITGPPEVRQEGRLVEGLYSIPFTLVQPAPEAQALLVPRFARMIEIRLNDQSVSGPPIGNAETHWDWYTPLMLALPAGALRQGENLLEVRLLASFQSTAGLSRVFIGPVAPLERVYDRLMLLQKRLPPIASLVTLTLALPLFLIWLHGRRTKAEKPFAIYGLLAAAMVVYALRSLHVYVEEAPVPMRVWVALVAASLAWAVGLFSVFILRFVGVEARWFEGAFAGFIGIASVVLFVFPDSLFSAQRTLFLYVPITVSGVVCILIACIRTARTTGPPDMVRDRFLVSLSLLLIVPAAVHDLMWVRGVLQFETVMWLPIIMPTMMLAISVIVANGYADAWVTAHELNRNLTRRIDEARDEIRQVYEQRIEAEHRAGIATERARLVEDLHDGVGNRLSLLLSMLQTSTMPPEENTRWVDACLQDLRMIITARDRETLGEALAELCWQHGSVLELKSVALILECAPGVRGLHLEPTRMLNVLRIVQEAISNAVRHGSASRIEVMAATAPEGSLRISVQDNGSAGLQPSDSGGTAAAAIRPVPGRGLNTMQARAARLGGRLEVTPSEAGWTVLLDIPTAPEPAARREPD